MNWVDELILARFLYTNIIDNKGEVHWREKQIKYKSLILYETTEMDQRVWQEV